MTDITLDDALKLFEFPRTLGTFEDSDVQVAIGRFGPYVRHKGKFVSIPKTFTPAELTIEQAIELIEAKRIADEKKTLRTYDEDPEIMLLNGRFGPYISYNKKNYKLPRGTKNPETLSYEDIRKIIEEADAAPAKTKRSTAKKKNNGKETPRGQTWHAERRIQTRQHRIIHCI